MAVCSEVGGIILGEHLKLFIDPAEEKLKNDFGDVTHTYIPHHSIIRIDEVDRSGKNRILESDGSNVTSFPGPAIIPQKKDR